MNKQTNFFSSFLNKLWTQSNEPNIFWMWLNIHWEKNVVDQKNWLDGRNKFTDTQSTKLLIYSTNFWLLQTNIFLKWVIK